MTALLLNASYEPLMFVSMRRAMILVLTDRATLLADSGEEWRSQRAAYPVPTLVRLKTMVKVPFQKRVPINRDTLAARDGGVCQVVGCDSRGTTVDHVVPKSRGGQHEWKNVALMCATCNETKGDRLLVEIGWRLKKEPRAPHGPWLLLAAARRITPREEWMPYLGAVSA